MARIIIADDDEIMGAIACETLIAGGHPTGLVTNGREALRVVRARKPDLVILDCNMPEMGGLLVLRELRQSAEFCSLPVLILTGRRSEKDVELALFQGADDYLKKPFDPVELLFRVDDLLAKRAQVASARQRRGPPGFGRSART